MLAGSGVVAGMAGGILLGHRLMPERRTVLGIPPGKGIFTDHVGFDLKPTAKQVSCAGERMTSVGQQLIRFADDLQSKDTQQLEGRAPSDEPDVFIDIPKVKVDEISLEVERLQAHLALQAKLANLLQLWPAPTCRLTLVIDAQASAGELRFRAVPLSGSSIGHRRGWAGDARLPAITYLTRFRLQAATATSLRAFNS